MTAPVTNAVPCGTCTLCCHDVIVLYPEDGDDPARYDTRTVWDPARAKFVPALKQRPNGACAHLGPFGCTIYDRRPSVCRVFDCRIFVKRFTPQQEAQMIRAGHGSPTMFAKGREMLAKHPI